MATRAAVRVAAVLARQPGLGTAELRAAVRTEAGMGKDRLLAALLVLGPAVVRRPAAHGKLNHYLDGQRLPDDVLKAMSSLSAEDQARVYGARPPAADENAEDVA
mgnify:CR=1 FL=1